MNDVWLFQISEILMPLALKMDIALRDEAKIALLCVEKSWFRRLNDTVSALIKAILSLSRIIEQRSTAPSIN